MMVCTAKIDYIKSFFVKIPKFAAVLWSEINEIIGRIKPRESSLKSSLSLDGINKFFIQLP